MTNKSNGSVPRAEVDKLKRILATQEQAIENRYKDLNAAIEENHLLAKKVEAAEKIAAQHKVITTNMQRMHQQQRVELESEIAARAKVERELRVEILLLKKAQA